MTRWIAQEDQNLVTVILPRRTSSEVADFLMDCPARFLLALNARGTVIKDRWYQALIPIISPEQEILQFLLPSDEVDILMEKVVALGQLRLTGAGAVFTSPCKSLYKTDDFPTWQNGALTYPHRDVTIRFKRNLIGITATVQSAISEAVARAAIKAGAHGPTIYYCEGRGVRDRLGIFRFTQNPDKETIQVIVDEMDAEAVFEAMAAAGRLDEPGRGIIYSTEVHRGIIKLPGVTEPTRHAASIPQIIHAIDDMKGSADWRATSNLIDNEPKSGGALSFLGFGTVRNRQYLHNLVRVSCVTKRRQVDTLMEAALAAGAPGATTIFGKFVESECDVTGSGLRLNRELGAIQMILPQESAQKIVDTLKQTTEEQSLESVCLITAPVDKVLTYLG
ncbi:MAG: P-II family nitrogen regulator [Verrucomicrobiota bacterium]